MLRVVGDLGIPVAFGLRSGHVSRANITLPIGVRARLEVGGDVKLRILEAATETAIDRGKGLKRIQEIGMKENPKHIHLIGICGTAMASLAGMLRERGHRVTGSDAAAYPPMSDVAGVAGDSGGAAVCGGEPRAAAGPGGRGQCDFARECGAGARAGQADSVLLDAADAARRVSGGARSAGGGGDARQDDDDVDAGVDFRIGRALRHRF